MSDLITESELLNISEIDIRARWQQRPPNEFPSPWASEWGFDEYGLWQTFVLPVEHGEDIAHKMRFMPKGEFLMGSPEGEKERDDNETQHNVTLTQGFWLGETTVSQRLWQAVMEKNPSRFKAEDADPANALPVENISWHDSQKFCQQLNARVVGLALALPSEAQWEYACRAGTTTPFNTGENLTTTQANYNGNREKTMPLRSFLPNGWGLYQMHGNVWEWCQDLYTPFTDAAEIDPVNDDDAAKSAAERVLRGGGWNGVARRCRSAGRNHYRAGSANGDIGLRVAQVDPAGKA